MERGFIEKDSFITLPGKGGAEGPLASQKLRPHLERVLESFIVMVQRGRGQPVESLLIDWW